MHDLLDCPVAPAVQAPDSALVTFESLIVPADKLRGLLVKARDTLPDAGPIDLIESIMPQLPQLDLPLRHIFTPGIYAREMTVPGKIHKHRHLVILSQGDISFYTDGKFVQRVHAPATFVSEPGDRRMGYTHTHTVWTTIHATDETDVDKLEADLFEPHALEATIKPLRITWQPS